MRSVGRFESPSTQVSLDDMLRRARHVLGAGFVLAVAAHICLTQVPGFAKERAAAKPLTTQFVKRSPRLTKPLELKKRPRPKRRAMQRQMVAAKLRAEARHIPSELEPAQTLRSLARPRAVVNRSASFLQAGLAPAEVFAQPITSNKERKDVMSMSLEMVDVEALDTGEYQAIVIRDPKDQRSVRGFFHFAYAYSATMRNLALYADDWRPVRGIRHLVDAVNKYTDIRCDLAGSYTYGSRKLFLTPVVPAVTRWAFRLTESEAINLGEYLALGGFLFIDPTYRAWVMDRPAIPSSYAMVEDALATQGLQRGVDYDFEKLPNDHILYHCFFDFDGPPPAADGIIHSGGHRIVYDYIEGISIDARLAVILSKKWYFNAWGDWGTSYPHAQYGKFDPERPLQFGVNLIVFVLTQEGSITNRLMDLR